MSTLFALFAIIAVPILFFMLTWVVVTACRIFFPDKPQMVERNATIMRRKVSGEGVSVPVGVREIREDQRHFLIQSSDTSYHYAHGDSEGLPLSWFEEFHERRH